MCRVHKHVRCRPPARRTHGHLRIICLCVHSTYSHVCTLSHRQSAYVCVPVCMIHAYMDRVNTVCACLQVRMRIQDRQEAQLITPHGHVKGFVAVSMLFEPNGIAGAAPGYGYPPQTNPMGESHTHTHTHTQVHPRPAPACLPYPLTRPLRM